MRHNLKNCDRVIAFNPLCIETQLLESLHWFLKADFQSSLHWDLQTRLHYSGLIQTTFNPLCIETPRWCIPCPREAPWLSILFALRRTFFLETTKKNWELSILFALRQRSPSTSLRSGCTGFQSSLHWDIEHIKMLSREYTVTFNPLCIETSSSILSSLFFAM